MMDEDGMAMGWYEYVYEWCCLRCRCAKGVMCMPGPLHPCRYKRKHYTSSEGSRCTPSQRPRRAVGMSMSMDMGKDMGMDMGIRTRTYTYSYLYNPPYQAIPPYKYRQYIRSASLQSDARYAVWSA